MKVKEVMSTNVKQISTNAMISEAAEKMKTFNIGVLPIFDNNKIVGLLTDRDIVVRAIAAGLDPKTTLIKNVYTPEVLSCSEDDDIETAAKIMEDNKVRRLMVFSNTQTLAGILSVGDLALKTSKDHLTYEVLEKVCEPARV